MYKKHRKCKRRLGWTNLVKIKNELHLLFLRNCQPNSSQGNPTTVPPKCIENTFQATQSTFRSLEIHSNRRYKILICLVILGQLESLPGLQYYFPENFRCNLKFYESENFSDSSFHRMFESENFRFPFSAKNSLIWGVEYKN